MKSLDSQLLHDPSLPDPHLLHDIPVYADMPTAGIGYFPGLDAAGLLHGFAWKTGENYAMKYEPGYPRMEAKYRVAQRLGSFLGRLGMEPLGEAVLANAVAGEMHINDIGTGLLTEQFRDSDRGWTLEGGAFFTRLPLVPFYALSSDCSWSFLYGMDGEGARVAGLVHAGRYEAERGMARQAVEHLIRYYGSDPSGLHAAVMPSLEPSRHSIRSHDIGHVIADREVWRHCSTVDSQGRLLLDQRGLIVDQFINAGVPADQIEVAMPGSYALAAAGHGFSHRYTLQHGAPFGGSVLAFQL